jgi:hypothetical protein
MVSDQCGRLLLTDSMEPTGAITVKFATFCQTNSLAAGETSLNDTVLGRALVDVLQQSRVIPAHRHVGWQRRWRLRSFGIDGLGEGQRPGGQVVQGGPEARGNNACCAALFQCRLHLLRRAIYLKESIRFTHFGVGGGPDCMICTSNSFESPSLPVPTCKFGADMHINQVLRY